ncbi:Cytochrome c554 and c-prime [Draconibacterium orientale]|jgi:nitrate/TMAO reductase-like tetraheme cytochrome c subunit|uniref:Cytochrome c554 and c-prime n=1 Tax=Draconibacterium orientale TaxID=1168034 RepID=A0A1H9YSL3_9BACT|nr:multiheme c-type cytochrome [Draconibacterium orientale]SES71648.1 Cytochrome c554 and c-prime [Draconibacterium orientale]
MKLKNLIILLGLAVLFSTAATAQTYKYIGAAKCKMCHNKPDKGEQFKVWEAGPHAKAMEALQGDEKNDPTCLKCHSTAGSVDSGLLAGLKADEGVSCESCHGPGSHYKSAAIMKNKKMALSKGMTDPTEETCKACHLGEKPEGHVAPKKAWNYAEFVKVIAHDDPTTN